MGKYFTNNGNNNITVNNSGSTTITSNSSSNSNIVNSGGNNVVVNDKDNNFDKDTTLEEKDENQEITEDLDKDKEESNKVLMTKTIMKKILWFILIILLIVAFIIIWKKFNNDEKSNKHKKLFIILLIGSATVIQFSISAYAKSIKGDLNGDKLINYVDVTILQKHLIALELLPNDLLEAADMNSDGKLTITDLSYFINKIEDRLNYEVELSSALEKHQFEKDEKIPFKFYAIVSENATIEEVTLNGEKYSVSKDEFNNEYVIELDGYKEAGVYDLNISEVKLDVGKSIKTNFTETIEVLKDIPAINNYILEEDQAESKVKLSFVLEDKDSGISNGAIKILTYLEIMMAIILVT